MKWKTFSEKPVEDKIYLVCYKRSNGTYSTPTRAYYDEDLSVFFPLDTSLAFPVAVDIYCEMPELPE